MRTPDIKYTESAQELEASQADPRMRRKIRTNAVCRSSLLAPPSNSRAQRQVRCGDRNTRCPTLKLFVTIRFCVKVHTVLATFFCSAEWGNLDDFSSLCQKESCWLTDAEQLRTTLAALSKSLKATQSKRQAEMNACLKLPSLLTTPITSSSYHSWPLFSC